MKEYQTRSPVLFLIFNRPQHTRRVFEAIRKVRPPRLYIAADGPRQHKPEDKVLCEEARQVVNLIDWDCKVFTRFREVNLGCKEAVSDAITWFFENEPQGIILEDDTLPSNSFFFFCDELLDKYKDTPRIMHIGGDNFHGGKQYGEGSYYFSIYTHIWGWASWARAWKFFDKDLRAFPEFYRTRKFSQILPTLDEQAYFLDKFFQTYQGKYDTWDYSWLFSVWNNDGIAIVPNKNLVKNIGFGGESTHTKKINQNAIVEIEEMQLLEPPREVKINRDADYATFLRLFKRSFISMFWLKLKLRLGFYNRSLK